PAWDAISPERPLRRLRLVEVNQPGATPLTAAALRADEKIVNYIKGLNYLDDRLTPLLLPFDADSDVALPPSQQAVADEVASQLQSAASQGRGHLPLVQLVGADVASKQLVAQQVASTFGLELQRLPADLIPADFHELETLLKLWDREHRLLPVALYIDASESDAAQLERPSSPQSRFLARAGGLVFLDAPDLRHLKGRPSLSFDIAKPTATEQRDLWRELLGDEVDDATASELAGQFSLNAATIHRIAQESSLPSSTAHCPLPTAHYSWTACRRATRPRLDALAQRIDARATWDDLVLPDDETQQLREIADQIQHRSRVYDDWGFRAKHNRGLGVSVLFAGESGTGKTMAAEVIANDLQLDLYRIDLSAVVNKYIGETEKNLRKLFDAADDSGAILFFDEADSLFGKRTEVKDSHDRYANLEVNYLLQRMEAYRGLAILATNLKSSLDQAFLRRLRFIVSFPVPDTAQRRELWSKAFPTETPLAPLDLDRLARLNVTGGNIHTIALNAAFASANDGPQLSMPHILKAARAEYRKLQKPINAADFRTPELEGSTR
ncbi:MAG: ATP-binding protein, partial [Candidatus Saccharimonas sp.]|nr:ATP-binding protein [Planctomycetaceae bacterium]